MPSLGDTGQYSAPAGAPMLSEEITPALVASWAAFGLGGWFAWEMISSFYKKQSRHA
jgi:hypothetical protein